MRCQQSKEGKKPIRIRVVIGGVVRNDKVVINDAPEGNSRLEGFG
jgi:hypothetical protein